MNAAAAFKLRWFMALAGAAMLWTGVAEAVPSYTIKECAQSDVDGATKHKKKSKRGLTKCEQAIKDIQSGKRKAPVQVRRNPPPVRTAAPQVRAAASKSAGPKNAGPKNAALSAQSKRRQPPKPQVAAPRKNVVTSPRDVLASWRRAQPVKRQSLKPQARRAAPAAPPHAAPAPRRVEPAAFTKPAPDAQAILRAQKAKQEKALRDATIASLASDTQAIGKERASVFGITLGEALVLPACDATAAGAKKTSTCLEQDRVGTRALAMRMADASRAKFPRDLDFDLVRLGEEQCPSWIGDACSVSVVTKSGFVVGVSFFTSGQPEKDVAKNIEDKYGQQPSALSEAVCAADIGKKAISRKGSQRTWALPHLNVNYTPLAGRSCDEGRVHVETHTLSKSLERPKTAPPEANTESNTGIPDDSVEPRM